MNNKIYLQGCHTVLISKICPFFGGMCLKKCFVLISKECPYFVLFLAKMSKIIAIIIIVFQDC